MTADTTADLAAIRARCEAATPGPWWTEDRDERLDVHAPYGDAPTLLIERTLPWDGPFIAHARADVPWLLALVERYEAALKEIASRVEFPPFPGELSGPYGQTLGHIARAALAGQEVPLG